MEQSRTKVTLRTRRAIKSAVIRLLSNHDLQSISVSQIAREAEINRGTFYSHFSTVRDVFDEIINEYVDPFFMAVGSMDVRLIFKNPDIIIAQITEIINSNLETYQDLLRMVGIESFLVSFGKRFFEVMISSSGRKNVPSPEVTFALQFILGGAIATYYTVLSSNSGKDSSKALGSFLGQVVKKMGEIYDFDKYF